MWLIYLGGIGSISSCTKKEPLWQLVPLGEGVVDSAAQGESYDNTVFFRFEDGLKTERNINTWTLAFESAPNGWLIRTNNGRNSSISRTGSTDFSAIYTASTGTVWTFDHSNGNPDSTAIGEWLNLPEKGSKNEVYIVSIGNDQPPAKRYRKIQFLSVSNTDYSFRYANLDGSDEKLISLPKATGTTYTYFDFLSDAAINYTPAPTDYDIVFTKYRTLLLDGTELTWYAVNGVLTNPVNTAAVRIDPTTVSFDSLNMQHLGAITFSQDVDVIGHDWKYFDLNGTGLYKVLPNLFIVKDAKGAIWKLEFIGYYNSSGVKGHSQFRYQRIS